MVDPARFDGRQITEMRYKANGPGFIPGPREALLACSFSQLSVTMTMPAMQKPDRKRMAAHAPTLTPAMCAR